LEGDGGFELRCKEDKPSPFPFGLLSSAKSEGLLLLAGSRTQIKEKSIKEEEAKKKEICK
jgi:hypothetical protein